MKLDSEDTVSAWRKEQRSFTCRERQDENTEETRSEFRPRETEVQKKEKLFLQFILFSSFDKDQ